MPAPTQVSICNLALSHVSQQPIQAIDEDSVQADACNRVYDACLREVLASYNWSFARTIKALALVSNYTPLTETYAYGKPSNCMAIWSVYDDGTEDREKGEIFRELYDPDNNQNLICTDVEDAYCEFTYYVTDTTKFEPYFVTALSHRIAAELAKILNGDEEEAKGQIMIYNTMISEAHRFSNYSNKPDRSAKEKSAFVDER